MNNDWKNIIKSAEFLITDRDIYNGITAGPLELQPDNIVMFTRTEQRKRDFAGTIHHRYVLIFFLKTSGTVFIQRHRISANEGDVLLVRPFEQHYYALCPDPFLWLFITFELPENTPFFLNRPGASLEPDTQQTFRKLLHAYNRNDPVSCKLLLTFLLCELSRHPEPEKTPHPPTPEQELIERVNHYIYDHLNKRFTVEDLARDCGVSASHLRFKFRGMIGVSLGQYIQRLRFDRARTLLQTTSLSIGETTYQCGFTSPAIFCRSFKNETGVSPKTFRDAARDLKAKNPPQNTGG